MICALLVATGFAMSGDPHPTLKNEKGRNHESDRKEIADDDGRDERETGEEHRDERETGEQHHSEAGHADRSETEAGHDDRSKTEAGRESHSESGHEHHSDGEEGMAAVVLTEAQKNAIGNVLAIAGKGSLYTELSFPGEVGINEDTLVHIVPRVSGIVLNVFRSIGDSVTAGEVLAVIDSPELGEAKAAYYEIYNEISCCQLDVKRAREVEAGVKRILDALDKKPPLEKLKSHLYGSTGEQGARLLSAYAEMILNRGVFQRKEKLFRDRLASENDYLATKTALEKSETDFFTSRGSAEFAVKQQRLERERNQRVNEFKLKTAERKLRILGLGDAEIERLAKTVGAFTAKSAPCSDADCKGCLAQKDLGHESQEHHFTEFSIVAPSTGTLIEKHATRGERVTDETNIFTLATLDTVWVSLRISARDLPLVTTGMRVHIETQHGTTTEGEISLVYPTTNLETRTTVARVVLANPGRIWRPGMFVTGLARIAAQNVAVVVPREAVQNLEGKDVVFVPEGKNFKPVPVVVGRGDRENVEILSGLTGGSRYVAKGAFHLKAINVTSGAGAHAGHGH